MTTAKAIIIAWITTTGWSGSPTDLECAVQNAWFEAGSYSDAHMITRVVINRTADKRWPDDICDVIWQHRQFSWTQDGKSDNIDLSNDWLVRKYTRMLMTVSVAMDDKIMDVNRPLWYHAHYVSPEWAKSLCAVNQNRFHTYFIDCED